MKDTRVTLTDAQRPRLAPAHDPEARAAGSWDFADCIAGAGGIRSTPDDMARFVAANLGLIESPLAGAMAASHKPIARADARDDVGHGWHVRREQNIVWHNGQTGGYHSFVAFVPERKVGVVLLDNYSSGLIDGLGMSLVKLLLGERVEPMPLAREVKVDPKTLDDFVGDYALSPIYFLKVEREGDHLTAAATAQPALRLYPQSESTFFYKAIRATVTFERNAGGKVVAVTFEQGGNKSRGPRIK